MPTPTRSCRVPTLLLALLASATPALAEQATGAGRSQRYAFVPGIGGAAPGTQTLYAVDAVEDLLLAYEYNARAGRLVPRAVADLGPVAAKLASKENRQPDAGIIRRYTLATGLPGTVANTQTLYVVDDARQLLYVYEYHGRAHILRLRTATNLHRYALAAAKRNPRPPLPGADKVPRFALAVGIAGVARNTQTLYIADDCHDLLFALEYNAAARAIRFRNVADLRGLADRMRQRPLPQARAAPLPVPRYTLATGIPGAPRGTETLYVLGDAKEALMILEYNARSHRLAPRQMADLHRHATQVTKVRPKP